MVYLGNEKLKSYLSSQRIWLGVKFNEEPVEEWKGLKFKAEQANSTIKLVKGYGTPPTVSLQYSIDSGNTWQDFKYNETVINLQNIGDQAYMKATTTNRVFSSSDFNSQKFAMTGKISASGNIMSLLDAENFATLDDLSGRGFCFYELFHGCTSLTTAPELPATTLANKCYFSMFSNCTSLTEAPELPARTLASDCYKSLFYNCTSLNNIKIGYVGNFSTTYFGNWVSKVPSGGTFYYNGSDTTRGVSAIPSGWTVETF